MDINRVFIDVNQKLKDIEIKSLSIYGSTVAGYAKPDSDIDVLVLANDFKDKVRYFYFDSGSNKYSVLVADLNETYKDAEKASLGEFVVGRLLNPFIPVYGEEIIRDIETKYKKRVIEEETAELYKEFQEFIYYLVIPLQYFLFSKLKKRYQIYPPALYSYAKTYSKELISKNLALTLEGFVKAVNELEYLYLEEYNVRVKKGAQIPQPFTIDELYYFQMAIKQYIFHGRSGKVSPEVVVTEALSKVKRSRNVKDVNEYLKKPELLLSLEGGTKIAWSNVEKELNAKLVERIGGILNPFYGIKVVEIDNKKYVIKSFKGKSELKWYMLGIAGKPIKPFEINPVKRMYNEFTGSVLLNSTGILVQKIYALSIRKKMLVKTYVQGNSLLDMIKNFSGKDGELKMLENMAQIFRTIHDAGYALGDSKPENFLTSKDGIYIIDLEQFKEKAETEDKGWDISEYIYYSLFFVKDIGLAELFVESFKKGYGEAKEVYESASSQKFSLPFLIMLRPDLLTYYRNLMKKIFTGERLIENA